MSVVSSTEEEEEGADAKGTINKCAKGEGDAVRRYLPGTCAGGAFGLLIEGSYNARLVNNFNK